MKKIRLLVVDGFDRQVFDVAMRIVEALSEKDKGWIYEHLPSIFMGFDENRSFFVRMDDQIVAMCGYAWLGNDRFWWMAIPEYLKVESPMMVARTVCRFLKERKVPNMRCTVQCGEYPEAFRLLKLAGFKAYAYDMATDTTYMMHELWTH